MCRELKWNEQTKRLTEKKKNKKNNVRFKKKCGFIVIRILLYICIVLKMSYF